MKLNLSKSSIILACASTAAIVAANQTLPTNVRLFAQLVVAFVAALIVPKP